MIRSDLPAVLAIERASFASAWSEEDFLAQLRRRNCIGSVAVEDKEIVGFAIYEMHRQGPRRSARIINIAADTADRRLGVGRALVHRLQQKYQQVEAIVSEANLGAHLFFRAVGFRAVEVIRGYYDNGMDAYRFSWPVVEEES